MPRLDLLRNGEIDLYRSSIKNAVETYPLEWKVIFEPLQNSIDAINDNASVSEGVIHISMNLDRNEVAISDNGTGFAYDKNLFFMNGGTKGSRQDTKGKIGVGLKVTIFSTNRFHLTSVYRDGERNKSWAVEATDAFRYLDLDSLQMSVSNPSDTQLATGTSIVYSFPDDSVTRFIARANDVMGEMSAVSPSNSVRFTKSLEYIFRTTGYAADVLRLLALPSTKRTLITMTVTYSSIPTTLPEPVREALSDLGGRIETTFENKFWDMEELIANQRGVNRPSVVSHKFYEPGVFGTFRPDTTIWVRKINSRQEMEELLSPRVRNSYGDLFPKINGIYLAMSVISNMRKFFFSTPPRFISINGTPSDHLLPNPVVNTLYANYVLCVIDVNSTLNYGKLQTTNRRLIHECGQLYLDIYRHAVIKIGEKVIGTHVEADTSSRAVQGTTNITGLPDLGIVSSMKKEPVDENALIALFFDLLGRGAIRDYEFYSLHAKRKYDATAMMKTARMQTIPHAANDNDLKNVEFKLHVSDLIEELEDGKKNLADITLVVVWDDDITGNPDAPSQYEVISIEDSTDRDSGFNRVNKCLFYRGTGIERQMIVMKDLVRSLRQT